MDRTSPRAAIRSMRRSRGLTQAELARKAGMPQSHLAKIEGGKVDMQWSTIERLLAAMNAEPALRIRERRGALVARARLRSRLPVKIVPLGHDDSKADLAFWLSRKPADRVAAVAFLSEQAWAAQGYGRVPRLAKAVSFRNLGD